MGIPKDNLQQAFRDDFDQFKEWYHHLAEEFPEDVDFDVLELLLAHENAENLFNDEKSGLLNYMFLEYIGSFCDYGPGKKRLIQNTTFLNIQNYERDFEQIKKHGHPKAHQLWGYILNGRSFFEPNQYYKEEENYCAYFNYEECEFLYQELSQTFDTSTPELFNKICGIGSVIRALDNRKGEGLLISISS